MTELGSLDGVVRKSKSRDALILEGKRNVPRLASVASLTCPQPVSRCVRRGGWCQPALPPSLLF